MRFFYLACAALSLFFCTASHAEMRCKVDKNGGRHCKSIQPSFGDDGSGAPIISGNPGHSYKKAPSAGLAGGHEHAAKKAAKKGTLDSGAAELLKEDPPSSAIEQKD
ncbi:hypothetical protein ACNRDB_22450 [Ralstonia pseudosolanacearum]|uniref:hypothetical protein n=1 Tax=Ralstonia pseudosolanacearum TaxID=1310165 RepID=UPI0018D0880E|nr:hypothetical protein [Ralstonia pseudosolanacearum]